MKTKRSTIWYIVFFLLILVILYPLLFAVSSSFKTLSEAYQNVLSPIPIEPTLQNYLTVFSKIPFLKITINTFIIAFIVAFFKVLTGVLAAYGFVYFEFKGRSVLYFILISTIFIPFTVTMLPNFLTVSKLGLKDNIFGVILPQLADATGIFLLHQHMRGIPKSLLEVAKMEKTPHRVILSRIVVPIIRPAILSTGIIFFINAWNEFVWPMLILKSTDNYTLSLALQMFVSTEGGTEFPVAMAVSVITMLLPLILYAICQKYIVDTFAQSGIK